ncbi:MAG: phage gp6-like head-tail connector protein [Clostridia bacterium]|nr:phage gp6-like head-tail connector protein [Clostridia bacterium]
MGVVTREEVYDYLAIDFEDAATERTVDRLIKTSERYLEGSLGLNYPAHDERVKELALLVISDLYDNRNLTGGTDKLSNSVRKLVADFELQIRLDMRSED